MKKLLLFATTMLLAASSVEVAVAKESVNAEKSAVEAVAVAGPRVYSNCYDGYLNVRAQPTTQSQIVGRLTNGSGGAELLGVEGTWSKVRVNGVVGYVASKYLQSTPTEPVYIDASAVVGQWDWDGFGPATSYTIQSNGKFVRVSFEGTSVSGTWYLSGYNLILKYADGYKVVCTVGDGYIEVDGFKKFK